LREARGHQLAGLRRLQASRRLQQELGGELDSQQRALLQRIADLRWKVRTAGGFVALRGRLPQPVGGPVVSIFGRPVEGGGLSLLRYGFTYRPSQREKVLAVADGLVRVAGPFEGYGRVVVVEHSDGYFSLYGCLSSTTVSEGQPVRRMEPVGRAGIDPMSGRTATYFELRHRERPLDPAVWLRR
jgi:septal ring factor EnvC (AmiA/AmiB activator)